MKKVLSVLTIPLTALAVLTGAIALPLLVRPTRGTLSIWGKRRAHCA